MEVVTHTHRERKKEERATERKREKVAEGGRRKERL